jgi:predicted transcriptional regulator
MSQQGQTEPAGRDEYVVYVRVDPDVHRALKHAAVDADRTVADIIRELIDGYLKRERDSG